MSGLSPIAFSEASGISLRAAQLAYKNASQGILGVNPTVLVVSPALESDALHLLDTETKDGGGSNPWKGTAELIVTPYVA